MKEKEMCSILEGLGWICRQDEAGDDFCTMSLGDIQIQAIPSIGRRSDHFRVSLMPSISSLEFSEVVGFILNEASDFSPVIVSNEPPEKLSEIDVNDVVRLSDKAIAWASGQNFVSGLEAYKALPTNAKGAMPLRHLAALVLMGDINRLEQYRNSFESGERLGFVPYISSEMIERALIKARERQSQKKGVGVI